MGRFKAQASIVDAIAFMTLVGVSVSLVFVMVSNYGESQDKLLRSSYTLNYIQSVIKELYNLDVSTLSQVTEESVSEEITRNGEVKVGPSNCKDLNQFHGRISVMDLIKFDVSEYKPGTYPFNDTFGSVKKMGVTALHCALRELMKPFTIAGYHYLAEVTIGKIGQAGEEDNLFGGSLHKINGPFQGSQSPTYYRISNSHYNVEPPNSNLRADQKFVDAELRCENVKRLTNTSDVTVITTPFIVRSPEDQSILSVKDDPVDPNKVLGFMKVRICVWPATRNG